MPLKEREYCFYVQLVWEGSSGVLILDCSRKSKNYADLGQDEEVCVGLWGSLGTQYYFLYYLSTGVMKQTKHLVLYRNWPIFLQTSIVQNYIPRWKALFSPDNKPGNLKKPERDLEGCFWSFQPMVVKFFTDQQWRTMMVVGTGCEWVGCVSCLLYLCHSVFDWLHSHRFLYLPVKPEAFFFWGGEWRRTTLPPFPPSTSPLRFLQMASAAHTSALCANHAHRLQILCLSRHTYTHKLTQITSQKLVL